MYDTAEVRWILDGPLPDAIRRWFNRDGVPAAETRDDRYVVLSGCETVGIKLRGGDGSGATQLDVKAMRGREREMRLAADVCGRAAAWSKWTLALADADAIVSGLEPPTPTITTHKRRLMRRYALDAGPPREVPVGDSIDTGCDVELTSIAIDGPGGPWWSLGLEAFGPPAQTWDALRALGEAWFEHRGAPPLDASLRLDLRSSCAYPAWLIGLLTSGR